MRYSSNLIHYLLRAPAPLGGISISIQPACRPLQVLRARHLCTTPPLLAPRNLPPIVTLKDRLKEFTVDEDIETREVQIKGDKGLSEPCNLFSVINSIDRSVSHVVQVSPPGDREIAIVQIMDRRQMVHRLLKKEELARKATHALKANKPKQLELNWAIASNDLQLKLKQLEGFLQKGRKVEVLLAAKRRQRRASPEEAEELLKSIRERADAIGAREIKPFEGKVLGQAVMMLGTKPLS